MLLGVLDHCWPPLGWSPLSVLATPQLTLAVCATPSYPFPVVPAASLYMAPMVSADPSSILESPPVPLSPQAGWQMQPPLPGLALKICFPLLHVTFHEFTSTTYSWVHIHIHYIFTWSACWVQPSLVGLYASWKHPNLPSTSKFIYLCTFLYIFTTPPLNLYVNCKSSFPCKYALDLILY